MHNQRVLVLDFGGQYNQLIARRVRECNVYCEVKPHSMTIEEIKAYDPIGRRAFTLPAPHRSIRRYSSSASPCSESATAASSWRITSAAR